MSSAAVILIVDDEKQIFQALRRSMHREHHELLYAANADDALKVVASRPVDIVIADENMPGMKGSELLAQMRQRWPDVVRMMLTGDCRLETVVSAVNRGEIFRFFIKPANEAEMIISIRDALAGRALHRQWERLVEAGRRPDGARSGPADPPPIVLPDHSISPTDL